jgi:hypothetical protein
MLQERDWLYSPNGHKRPNQEEGLGVRNPDRRGPPRYCRTELQLDAASNL